MNADERRIARRLVDEERRRQTTPPDKLIGSVASSLPQASFDAADGDPLLALDLALDEVDRRRVSPRT